MRSTLAARKKVYAERVHAKRRALERAGVAYNRFEMRRMAEQIQSGYSVLRAAVPGTKHTRARIRAVQWCTYTRTRCRV